MAAGAAVMLLSQDQDVSFSWQGGWGSAVCKYPKNRQEAWGSFACKSRKVSGCLETEAVQRTDEISSERPGSVSQQDASGDGNGCAHEAALEDPEMDAPSEDVTLAGMARAVMVLLQGLGEDVSRDGLLRTPLRMAKALRFATKGYRESVQDAVGTALFALPGSSRGGSVIVRDIDTFSHCRACLLPFRCRCHIAYVPGAECVVGLSKLARLAEVYSRRLQTPEQLAQDIADGLVSVLAAKGVAVVVASWHIRSTPDSSCIPDASEPAWVPHVASSASGCFSDSEQGLWDEFVALLALDPTTEAALEMPLRKPPSSFRDGTLPCPFSRRREESVCDAAAENLLSEIVELDEERPCVVHQDAERGKRLQSREALDGREAALPRMVVAMKSLLQAAGGDLRGDDLSVTSERYVRWLLSATSGSQPTLESVLNQQNGLLHSHRREGARVFGAMNGSTGKAGGKNGRRNQCADIAMELSVPLLSQCEHHLLPFLGQAHVGYVLGSESRKVDRGVVEKIVALYSKRLQVQERLTQQIAEAIASSTHADGVIVVVEASHMCMMARGIEKPSSSTATTEVLGLFENDPKARAAFLRQLPRRHAGLS